MRRCISPQVLPDQGRRGLRHLRRGSFRREDDNEETARKRLEVHMRQTHPVTHYYAQDGRLYSIDGVRSIDEVFADVENYLSGLVEGPDAGEVL